ncbi:ABC transporter substrate-binding protein, partial [Rhizobium leguminosarum]|uniref:ABC transporter substrate-binding protein n=1 Tax=Rhizobium leguminosarum TaxID=384 RepID=UPI003F9BEC1C
MRTTFQRHRPAEHASKDSPIKSVEELKGKKVAFNKGSNVHYMLVKALEEVGLTYEDVE